MRRPEEEWWSWSDNDGSGGLLWIGSVCWAATRVEEQCGAGGDFVLHVSDGYGTEGLGQLQGMS